MLTYKYEHYKLRRSDNTILMRKSAPQEPAMSNVKSQFLDQVQIVQKVTESRGTPLEYAVLCEAKEQIWHIVRATMMHSLAEIMSPIDPAIRHQEQFSTKSGECPVGFVVMFDNFTQRLVF